MSIGNFIDELEALGVELLVDDEQLRFRAPKGVMNEERKHYLKAHKQQIMQFLGQEQAISVTADVASLHEPFHLTDVQTAYLLGRNHSFGYGGVACHGYLELHYPELSAIALSEAINVLIQRHDMLRAIIEQEGYQRILEEVPYFSVPEMDCRGFGTEETERHLSKTRAEMDHRIYSTDQWPLFDLRVTQVEDGAYVHFSMDSLIADWASAEIIFKELDCVLAGQQHLLPPLNISFRDYLLAERQLKETQRYHRDRQYWLARLEQLPPAPDLPLQKSSSTDTAVHFKRFHWCLAEQSWRALCQWANEAGVTPSIAVLTAYASVLQRWSKQPHFTLSMTLLNRMPLHEQVDSLVGDFTSVNLLEVMPAAEQSFAQHAMALGNQLFDDLDHRLFSGVEVVREITRSAGAEAALMPFVYTSAIGLGSTAEPESGRVTGYGITQTPQVLLDCQVIDSARGLEVNWDVRQGMFPEGLVEDLFQAFQDTLSSLAQRHDVWANPVQIPLPYWQQQGRLRANATAGDLPHALLHKGIVEQAYRTPDAIAIEGHGGTKTYRQLVLHAAAVAQHLKRQGSVSDIVAIAMEKGPDQIVAILAVLMAGRVYLPLDMAQPALRRDKVLAIAKAEVVLTQSWLDLEAPLAEHLEVVNVDQLEALEEIPEIPSGDPDALAYIIFTSGSTGEPKGVMISHRSALNTIDDINLRFDICTSDKVLALAQISFDLSVYDIFGPLATGARIIIPEPNRSADPSYLARMITTYGVTVWNSVPAQLQMLAHYLDSEPQTLNTLRLGLLSGDWIPLPLPEQIRRFAPVLELVGLGGATEASIWSNYHLIKSVDPSWVSIPYGLPLRNQGFRVLDSQMRDAPVWQAGDLYITGQGLAQGYLGDKELTQSRFFEHPIDGQRLYKTGDKGRYLSGGEIEFLGRDDGQIKIRGHRIELGEIEATMLSHPAVASASVVVNKGDNEHAALVGYVDTVRRSEAMPSALSTEALVAQITRYTEKKLSDVAMDQVPSFVANLHHASWLSMLQAFANQGLFAEQNVYYNLADIQVAMAADSKHYWLIRQWLKQLCEAGYVSQSTDGTGYQCAKLPSQDRVTQAWQEVAKGIEYGLCTQAFVDYHVRHVELIKPLFSGEQNPFELLFPQGDQSMALAVYRDDVIARHNNQAVAALVNRIATEQQPDRPLRILEVGAGTGATTAAVAPMLDGYAIDYRFTDMTAFFLPEARKRFADYPWMHFSVLDLNEDYRLQGLSPNSVDVLICAGVLNSTHDPEQVLQSIRELLAPGGWLIVTEPVQDLPNIMLTQGFMVEPAHQDHLLGHTKFVAREQWQQRIRALGGEISVCLPEPEHALSAYGIDFISARFKQDREFLQCHELSRYLHQRLPDWMVPETLQIVDQMPLTINGKVDRKTLLEWIPAEPDRDMDELNGQQMSPLEQTLCALWADALGVAQLNKTDNFYDRGADSLILARVAGRLREEVPEAAQFAYDQLLRHMLNEPNVASLARMLTQTSDQPSTQQTSTQESMQAREREGSNALIIPFGGEGDGPVRVMFHAALGTMDYFQHLGRAMAEQNLGPVIGFAVRDTEAYLAHAPSDLINAVADDYAQRLIDEGYTRFQLIGYCLGGLLATEVARRLMERGMDVVDLALVDSIPMFIDTDDELAYEAIFVPNLNLDPVQAVFGEGVAAQDVYRAIDKLMTENKRVVAKGALAQLSGDSGLTSVAQAVQKRMQLTQAERMAEYAQAAASQAGIPVSPELIPALFKVCSHSMRAALFQPDPYIGDMRFLRCEEEQSFGITAGVGHLIAPFWEETCLGVFSLHNVPGNHFSVIEPPHVEVVADYLAMPLRSL